MHIDKKLMPARMENMEATRGLTDAWRACMFPIKANKNYRAAKHIKEHCAGTARILALQAFKNILHSPYMQNKNMYLVTKVHPGNELY